MSTPTPGELAYIEDVRRCPTYHDGSARPPFAALGAAVRDNWERYPTPREFRHLAPSPRS